MERALCKDTFDDFRRVCGLWPLGLGCRYRLQAGGAFTTSCNCALHAMQNALAFTTIPREHPASSGSAASRAHPGPILNARLREMYLHIDTVEGARAARRLAADSASSLSASALPFIARCPTAYRRSRKDSACRCATSLHVFHLKRCTLRPGACSQCAPYRCESSPAR